MSDFAKRSPEHESLAAEWGLLKIELHHCKKQLKEARTIACKMLDEARAECGQLRAWAENVLKEIEYTGDHDWERNARLDYERIRKSDRLKT